MIKKFNPLLALIGIAAFATVGCNMDKSEATQNMPSSASAPNEAPKAPSNLPPQAQDAINKAAPPSSTGG